MSFDRLLRGYHLTTAEILYRMPDYPDLFQEFIWQDYDIHPQYPHLLKFLDFWNANLDGKLVRVRVASRGLISPTDFKHIGTEIRWN